MLPLRSIDPQIVASSARALDRYGPDFSYSHFVAVANPVTAAALTDAMAGTFALAQLPATRKLVRWLRPSGAGPTAEQRRKGWFRVRFVGEGGGRRVLTEVAGGDPGYGETSKMLAESALCLANDVLPALAGQAARVADVDRLTLHLKEELRVLTAPCGCGPSRRRERPARRIGWWQQPAWATSSIHRW